MDRNRNGPKDLREGDGGLKADGRKLNPTTATVPPVPPVSPPLCASTFNLRSSNSLIWSEEVDYIHQAQVLWIMSGYDTQVVELFNTSVWSLDTTLTSNMLYSLIPSSFGPPSHMAR